jgi:hypothetical protein
MKSDYLFSKATMLSVYQTIHKRCTNYPTNEPYIQHIIEKLSNHKRLGETGNILENIIGFRNLLNDLTKDFTTKKDTLRFLTFFFNKLLKMNSSYEYWDINFIYSAERNTCRLILRMMELYYALTDFEFFMGKCQTYYSNKKTLFFRKRVNPSYLRRDMIEPSLEHVMTNIKKFWDKFHFENPYVLHILARDIFRDQKTFLIPNIEWSDILITFFNDIYALSYITFCDFQCMKGYEKVTYNLRDTIETMYIKMSNRISNMNEWEAIIGEDELLCHPLLPHPNHFLYKNNDVKQEDTWLEKAKYRYEYNDNVPNSKKKHFWKMNHALMFHSWEQIKEQEPKIIKHSSEHESKPQESDYRYSCSMPKTIKTKKKKTTQKLKQEQRSKKKRSYLESYLEKSYI